MNLPRVLVTGGTGNLGKAVVSTLVSRGYEVGVLRTGTHRPTDARVTVFNGNLVSGDGLRQAVHDAGIIVHCASHPGDAEQVDVTGTKNLIRAAMATRVAHLIYISIVGIQGSTFPYYRAKRTAEELLLDQPIPCSILRSSQFHEFVEFLLQNCMAGRQADVVSIPEGIRFQSVSRNEVARKLADLCGAAPRGLMADFTGPELLTLGEMASAYFQAASLPYTYKETPVTDELFETFRSGIHISPEKPSGNMTWKMYLDAKFHGEARSAGTAGGH